MDALGYLHLLPDQSPPTLPKGSFRAIVLIEEAVSVEWRMLVSEWLVASGCLYMLAWGQDCGAWDDSVDFANLDAFDYGEIPDDREIMTTWHDDQSLSEVFSFAKQYADHPSVTLTRSLIVHIAPHARERELLSAYREATLT